MRLCGFCRGTGVNKEHVWPDWLRKIDTLLEDDAVIEVVAQALDSTVAMCRPSYRRRVPRS